MTAATGPAAAPLPTEPPPAPPAQDWALAATDTLKNSKRYRYTWGQQVRRLMGTAFEGSEPGAVRFRMQIAPRGHLAQIATLWSTSPAVEPRARQRRTPAPHAARCRLVAMDVYIPLRW